MDVPTSFRFPFNPYDIQESFMKNLYIALEQRKLGIFESPTGTGKSLSLCCGALKWLQDHEQKLIGELEEKIAELKVSSDESNADDTDWISSEYNKIKKTTESNALKIKLENILTYNKKIEDVRARIIREKKDIKNSKHKWLQNSVEKINAETVKDEIPLDEDLLIEEPQDVEEEVDETLNTEAEKLHTTKIFFCSRTHSQLSQFVNEIKKTDYSSEVRVVSLASRQQYCINNAILKLKNSHLINERCLELQKGKNGKTTKKSDDGKVTKKSKCSSGCQFYNSSVVEQLRDEAIIEIKDVEDMVSAAKEINACPYYSARAAVNFAQVVVVPYQTLLHESTRIANGIDIKDNIIIIDEAHNLLDTIEHIHSAQITGYQLHLALDKLKHYKEKFGTKFAAKNLLLLNQVIFVVGKILGLLNPSTKQEEAKTIYTLGDFVLTAEIDNYNLRPLLDFCVRAKLAQKLHGFVERYPFRTAAKEKNSNQENAKHLQSFLTKMSEEKNKKKNRNPLNELPTEIQSVETQEKTVSVGNVIQSVVSFLEMLTSNYNDGRISTCRGKTIEDGYHKFMLLNPAAQFTDIVKEARSVILAGGTMQPFSEFRDQLFLSAGAEEARIIEYSCGHVIPPENILPICLSSGPSGKKLNFSYEFRNSPDTLNEFGRILQNICNVVPGGVVCFFPSYNYEETVYTHLLKNGVLDKIGTKKKVFREPKTTAEVDQVLEGYSKIINRAKQNTTLTGALMLSVVGGKLSEGLNFSDDLGRCVIVVGLPYPNIKSIELQEKLKYLNENVSPAAGNRHYENVCLKAVNQCIGRAVRHANDYATVILIDERFSRSSVSNALPKWIQRSLITDAKFGQTFGLIAKFFSSRKTTQ